MTKTRRKTWNRSRVGAQNIKSYKVTFAHTCCSVDWLLVKRKSTVCSRTRTYQTLWQSRIFAKYRVIFQTNPNIFYVTLKLWEKWIETRRISMSKWITGMIGWKIIAWTETKQTEAICQIRCIEPIELKGFQDRPCLHRRVSWIRKLLLPKSVTDLPGFNFPFLTVSHPHHNFRHPSCSGFI